MGHVEVSRRRRPGLGVVEMGSDVDCNFSSLGLLLAHMMRIGGARTTTRRCHLRAPVLALYSLPSFPFFPHRPLPVQAPRAGEIPQAHRADWYHLGRQPKPMRPKRFVSGWLVLWVNCAEVSAVRRPTVKRCPAPQT